MLKWNVGLGVADGRYEIRAMADCEFMSNAPEDYNERATPILSGIIDRRAPRQFSLFPNPASGTYAAGDDISLEFNEELDCNRPFSVDMTVGDLELSERELDIKCEGSVVKLSTVNAVSLDVLLGQEATVTISNVCDFASNCLETPASWSFTYPDGDGEPSSVSMTLPGLAIAYDPRFADLNNATTAAVVDALLAEIAAFLGVPVERLSVTQLASADGGSRTTVYLNIGESDTGLDAAVLAILLRQALEDPDSAGLGGGSTGGGNGGANSSTAAPSYLSGGISGEVSYTVVASGSSSGGAAAIATSTAGTDDDDDDITHILLYVLLVLLVGSMLMQYAFYRRMRRAERNSVKFVPGFGKSGKRSKSTKRSIFSSAWRSSRRKPRTSAAAVDSKGEESMTDVVQGGSIAVLSDHGTRGETDDADDIIYDFADASKSGPSSRRVSVSNL